jgi:hypothetical protein
VIGFTGLLQILTTINYNRLIDSRTLWITRTQFKYSQSALTSHFLVTDLNSGDSSASMVTIACWLTLTTEHHLFSASRAEINWTHSSNCPSCNISARTTYKTLFFYCCLHIHFHEKMFTKPLPRNYHCLFTLLHGRCIETSVRATLFLAGCQ